MKLSDYLNDKQVRALQRVGDILIPGNDAFPGFCESGCVKDVARMLAFLPDRDLKDLQLLLSLISTMPNFLIKGILSLAKKDNWFPGLLGAKLRIVMTGLKGLVMLPYYNIPIHPTGFKASLRDSLGYTVAIRSRRDSFDEVTALIEAANPLTDDLSIT